MLKKGFTLIEVVVAFTIFAIFMGGVAQVLKLTITSQTINVLRERLLVVATATGNYLAASPSTSLTNGDAWLQQGFLSIGVKEGGINNIAFIKADLDDDGNWKTGETREAQNKVFSDTFSDNVMATGLILRSGDISTGRGSSKKREISFTYRLFAFEEHSERGGKHLVNYRVRAEADEATILSFCNKPSDKDKIKERLTVELVVQKL